MHTLPQQGQQSEELAARASVTIPYIHGLSQSICRVLSSLDIKVTFRPLRTLRKELVHPKDTIPEWQRKDVVYSVPCNECSRAYIGQTGRSLDHRIAEHWRAFRNGMSRRRHWQSMCLLLGTKWTYLQQWSMLTHTPRPAAFLSPGTSSMNRPLSTWEGRLCQDSTPPYWTDIVLCFYYIFCLTLHLIMYICRSMLPYYYSFIVFFVLFLLVFVCLFLCVFI